MHYYKFHIGDYQSHTAHLSPIEDIAYRRMLDYCYLHESHLPNSVDQIARLIRMREHCDSIAVVLEEFFSQDEYGYFQPRIVEEVDLYKDKQDKAKSAAAARWAAKQGKSNADALPAQSECNANHKPLTINQEPIIITSPSDDPKPKADPIPYQQIVDHYNQELGVGLGLPQVKVLSNKRKGLIKGAWNRDKGKTDNPEYWRRYFAHMRHNVEWIRPDQQRGANHSNWKADFDYCIRETTWVKVLEGSI